MNSILPGANIVTEKKGQRTVMRIQLPPGTGQLTRKEKLALKKMVRKKVKSEKKKIREAIIHDQRLIRESLRVSGSVLPDVASRQGIARDTGHLHRGKTESLHAPVVSDTVERDVPPPEVGGTEVVAEDNQ